MMQDISHYMEYHGRDDLAERARQIAELFAECERARRIDKYAPVTLWTEYKEAVIEQVRCSTNCAPWHRNQTCGKPSTRQWTTCWPSWTRSPVGSARPGVE